MKKTAFLFLAMLTFHFSWAQDTTKILFIGNSHTFVNDLPETFFQFAKRAGKIVFVDSYTMGGATLQMHFENATTIQKIHERQWDYVVLQEQSQIPSFIPERDTMFYPFAIALDSIIHSNWLCTQTLFFMTWAHKNGDLGILQNGGIDTFEEMQHRLRSGYLTIADSLSAGVVPCGWAWREVIQNNPIIELYSPDNYHPNENGTYLAVCAFYASIFRESAIGVDYFGGLSISDAAQFQSIASQVVLDSLDLWNIGQYNPIPTALFDYSQSGEQILFTNHTLLADHFRWDFGDGVTSELLNPSHIYINSGDYDVQLISSNNCYSDTLVKTIHYTLPTTLNSNERTDIAVFPNPFLETIYIENLNNEQIQQITIFQIDGNSVFEQMVSQKGIIKINLSGLKNGLYVISIRTNQKIYLAKIIKAN